MRTLIFAICRSPACLLVGYLLQFVLLPISNQCPAAMAEEAVDFVRDIQPIFTNHCYNCHADQSVEGGIRWDRKSAIAGGDSGQAAVVPGEPETGTLLAYVRGDADERMPPEDEGAPQKITHWSLQSPERKPLPTVEKATWPKNPIDHFVLARLEEAQLSPQKPADRYTLARRVYLDLLGLPPTPEQVDLFLSDTQPGAYERLVDRLLSSPEYGERWARMWLDLARYADTQGYEKDARRTIYSFRDWVIKAFNGDMPFDQFTIEQLAGDMLPNPTTDQLVATAFHRNTMTNTEGAALAGTTDIDFR